jgi:hypothetical protein
LIPAYKPDHVNAGAAIGADLIDGRSAARADEAPRAAKDIVERIIFFITDPGRVSSIWPV